MYIHVLQSLSLSTYIYLYTHIFGPLRQSPRRGSGAKPGAARRDSPPLSAYIGRRLVAAGVAGCPAGAGVPFEGKTR